MKPRFKKFAHQIRSLSVPELNRVLQEIQLRLDSLEGVGQNKDMLGSRIVRVGNPEQDQDAINMRYLDGAIEDSGLKDLFQAEADRYDTEALGIDASVIFGSGIDDANDLIDSPFAPTSDDTDDFIDSPFAYSDYTPDDAMPQFSDQPSDDSVTFSNTSRINWRKITADSVTLSAGTSANTVADLQTANDGNVYTITEAAATPGTTLIVDFENVKAFNWVKSLATYEGSTTHAMEIELYNWVTTNWDHFQAIQTGESNSGTIFGNESFFVPDDANYIGTGADIGNVRVRFNHPMAGNVSHNLYIDCVSLYQ